MNNFYLNQFKQQGKEQELLFALEEYLGDSCSVGSLRATLNIEKESLLWILLIGAILYLQLALM